LLRDQRFPLFLLCFTLLLVSPVFSVAADVTKAHGIALHGEPKYPADFQHFDYVNPDAPKSGSVRLMGSGTFDTLNPYTLKGISPFMSPGFSKWGVFELNEPLMVGTGNYSPSGDEAQTAYGLIAESIEYPTDRSWAIFKLRPEARFHDGRAITVEDVIFSFHTLIEHGHPRFAQAFQDVAKVEKLAQGRVKFTFKPGDTRALPLRVGELPVLSKAFWQGQDFEKSLLEPPLGSGPYRLTSFEPGRRVVFERVKDYWGKDLPVNQGRYNFDQVSFDYYRDLHVAFEAFKSNEFDVYREYISSNWATGYDFPALQQGRVKKLEIDHSIPTGYQAFFFNTRREIFNDVRVREAIGLMFDFEWLNRSLFFNAYARNKSFFPNTELAANGLPSVEELALLEPYREQLPTALFTNAFKPPVTNGKGILRQQQRQALKLLKEAGWKLKNNQMTHLQSGETLSFEVLFDQPSFAKVLLPFKRNLERIGIDMRLRNIDRTQFKNRVNHFDFDMIVEVLVHGLSPSYELNLYFHSEQANTPGALNYSGVRHPVIDELVDKIIGAPSRQQLLNASRALDRVLLWHHYTIPQYHLSYHRIAHWNKFGRPAISPPYTFNFRDWWIDEKKTTTLTTP